MLSLRFIQENVDEVITRLKIKNFDASSIIQDIVTLDRERKELQAKTDGLQAEMNKLSKEIGNLFQEGKKDEAENIRNKTTELKESIKGIQQKHSEVTTRLQELIIQVPNLPHPSVPAGNHAEDNEKIREGGELPKPGKNGLPHWELAKKYDIIDFELGNKLTGSGFPVYKGKGAKLQRALINFFLDEALQNGYHEVLPPILVNEDSGFGTGQLPDKEGQMYHVGEDNLYLIPTAEVPVTNMFRDVILDAGDFPVKHTAYTPCFRREAGSYGKDVRGLNRLHQFDKVEIVQIVHPGRSNQALEEMVC